MSDDPDLNSLNNAVNKDPTNQRITVEKIKSDNEPVGGVDLGAIDTVPLTEQDQASQIESAVDRALAFRAIKMKSKAVVSAVTQVRQDFIGINQYINARKNLVTQIDRLIPKNKSEHHVDRQQKINAIILERNLGLRFQEANKIAEEHLNVSKNLLKFQTTTAATFMRQSLALQYHQIYSIKDLLTMTKAFADMAENKLEAIKINTKLPDTKKETIFQKAKKLAIKKGLTFAGKHLADFLEKETHGDLLAHINDVGSKIKDKIAKFRKGDPSSDAPREKMFPDGITKEAIWNKTKAPRSFIADLIRKQGEKKPTQESLLKDILKEVSGKGLNIGVGMPMMAPIQTMTNSLDSPAIIAALAKIETCICDLRGSFNEFKGTAQKNYERLHDLVFNIDKTLTSMPSMGSGNGGSNTLQTPSVKNQLIGTGVHRRGTQFYKKMIPGFLRAKHFVFMDIYLKDNVDPGNPLVSKEQLDNRSVTRIDGKPVNTLKDLSVPILDIATGNVLISKQDLKIGLVDVHNKPFKNTGLFNQGLVRGVVKLPFTAAIAYGKFVTDGVGAFGRLLFKRKDKSPYVDVYLKDKIIPGRPLVTGEKFRQGLVFADGSRVLNVNKITQPVLDPITGQTLITEDDIKTGLVDVFGEPINNRSSRFSVFGGIFDVAKFGIKTAGSTVGGLTKPIIGMYAEMFKMLPKAILGVGGFISKSLIGILSGKAPGALAKGLVGIAGSITKMYASMFNFGLQGMGSVGKTIFGKLFGGKRSKAAGSSITKKDIYDLITVRLDRIYSLIDDRIAKPVREGSYQDHENRLKSDEDKLVHLRDEEGDEPGSKNASVFGRLAKLLGINSGEQNDDNDGVDSSKPKQSGGVISDAEHLLGTGVEDAAEITGGSYLARKLSALIPGFKGLKTLGKGILSTSKNLLKPGVNILSRLLKIGGKDGSKDLLKKILEIGGKSLLKKIPGVGLLAGVGFGADRAIHGDYVGAAGEVGSGLASVIPFFGTAASVGIDGWLAYRDIKKGSLETSALFKARLKVYGVDTSLKDTINQLEQRTLQIVVAKGSNPLLISEVKTYAKLFGFDPNNTSQFQYFCSWVDNRFRNGYLTYLATIKKHGYSQTSDDDIKETDVPKILAEYTADCASFLTKYSKIIPTLAAFKIIKQPANNNSTTSPFQANNTPPTLPKPTATQLPITPQAQASVIQAAYTTPTIGQPQTYNAKDTGVATTQQLSYNSTGSTTTSVNLNGLPTTPVGTGQCVALVEQVCRIGHTSTWKRGQRVVGTSNIKPGTPIATFDQDGTYGNHTDGSSHAAIYLGVSQVYPGGIRVYDQWLGHAPSPRDIRPQEAMACNSANAFCIILAGQRIPANNNTPQPFTSFNNAPLPGSPNTSAGNGPNYGPTPSGGFTPFNGASLPGASGGIQPSTAVQMASARAGYVQQAGGYGGTVNSAGTTTISNAETQARANQAVTYFMSQGWTKEQASGIVGSLIRESQLNTTAVGDGGNAVGIAQWHSDRAGPMLQALYPGKQMSDLSFQQQLAGIQWELNGPESRAAQMLRSAKDPGTAGAYASKYYERPANTNSEMSTRASLAQNVYQNFNAKTPGQTASTTPGQPTVPPMSTKPGAGSSGTAVANSGTPSSNVITPVQTNVAVAGNVQQATVAATQSPPSSPPPQIMPAAFHPDVVAAIKNQNVIGQQQIAALSNIHSVMSNVHNTLQQAHGPNGLLSTIADNTANTDSPSNTTVVAPTIMPQQNNDCDNNVGFSVMKKRNARYNM